MGRMQLPEEFKEFINLLNLNGVKYLLLGGWAVGYYSNPRATKDIDFLVFIDNLNLKKLEKVFYDFKSPPINIEILKEEKGCLFIGSPPLRIEVISNADGINIKDCYKRKNIIEIDNVKINIISKEDLIINKKSTNRLKDQADAEVLENNKINPDINTKDILKTKLILSNIVGAYGNELNEENIDMKKRKKDSNYKNDLNIINKTIMLYNKALDTKSEKDVFALHNSFKKNPLTNNIYDVFRYKIIRNKIYNEIEYRYKLLLKNEYSYLINNNSGGGRK
ncbi:MAG: hypothetical protein FWF68_05920 [Spirochaetes bacterium]|nr:hypothetical protein [Spirochaetota bacterium]